MKNETFESVWDAICDTPEEAANMKARAELMLNIRERVKAWDMTQEEAAKRLHLTRPRMSDLLRGKIEKFSLDSLVNIATAAGLTLHIKVTEAA